MSIDRRPRLRPGDFIISGISAELAARVADLTGVHFDGAPADANSASQPISRPRVGMYQRYLGGNMDEGWTRWLLEHFAFAYTSLMDDAIRDGDLHEQTT